MGKIFKTILIISIAFLGFWFLSIPETFAQDNLVVEFEQTPLFNEANFLPGQGVTRWVKVTNNSSQTQRIATEAINVSDPNRLGDVLELEIKEGGSRLYKDALSKFFTAGEVYLSDLAGNGAQTQYDFNITFYSGVGNSFQGKSLSFDLLVGFQGTEGGLLPGAGGGAGGVLPPGLTIQDETVRITEIGETNITITWLTSYFSTSQVIYAREGEPHTLDLTDTTGTPPKYGYARTTPEYDVSPKVTFHSVIINGLDPGTKYYYRTVSHASLAISREYSFTTLGVKMEEEVEEEMPPEEIIPPEEEVTVSEEIVRPPEELVEEKAPEEAVEEEAIVEEEIEKPALVEEKPLPGGFTLQGLLAAIGALPFNLKIILIIAGIIIIGLIILRLTQKKKIKS